MKTLIVIPTYNEVQTIGHLLNKLVSSSDLHVLIVDDNSNDGTKEIVNDYLGTGRVFLLERSAKLGLGTAYVEAFKWGLKGEYEIFFEMDGDMSHDPAMIPSFIEKTKEGFDVVIGSRYVKGTISVVGWDFKRLLLSKFANYYVRKLTPLKYLTDITSGYRCYKRHVLNAIDLNSIKSNGYAFQIEMAFRAHKMGFKICEVPIIFYERNGGSSKMSREIALEAAIMVWRLKFSNQKIGR